VAQSELGRLWASPQVDLAPSEIAEAEAALTQAESTYEATVRGIGGRWDAEDDAYVARRMAERARIATLYEADREVLREARGAVRRLTEYGERRSALLDDVARRLRAVEEAHAHAVTARRTALDRARRAGDEIVERPEGLLFRVASERLFIAGTSLLRDGADERLDALAEALRDGPACDVLLQVLDDVPGEHISPERLAWRRWNRLHDALVARGVPSEAFARPLRYAPFGTQVDVLVIERPVAPPP
jgi:outer membrane protein OmpA-like peptidoglycan-associated protein